MQGKLEKCDKGMKQARNHLRVFPTTNHLPPTREKEAELILTFIVFAKD